METFLIILGGSLTAAALLLTGCWALMIRMPGKRFQGPLPPMTREEEKMAGRLERTLHKLATEIGERNVSRRFDALTATADFIEETLGQAGYEVSHQPFECDGQIVHNLWAEKEGAARPEERLIVGAHYDTVPHSPGANDNGSAVAANLELARAFRHRAPARTLRFVFFVNEEFPYFMTPRMGSLVHARQCRAAGEKIKAMLCLETMGSYYDLPGTQHYPPPLNRFYPSTADFITFVGNLKSRRLVHAVVRSFRQQGRFPCEGIAATERIRDICRSDHYPFWQAGWPAVMVTDTADFRYAHYHKPTDTVEKVNLHALSRVTSGLVRVLEDLDRTFA